MVEKGLDNQRTTCGDRGEEPVPKDAQDVVYEEGSVGLRT